MCARAQIDRETDTHTHLAHFLPGLSIQVTALLYHHHNHHRFRVFIIAGNITSQLALLFS